MKTLALLFSLSLLILLNPTHSKRNPIRLPTAAHVALASDTPVLDNDSGKLRAGAVNDLMALLSPVVLDTDEEQVLPDGVYDIVSLDEPVGKVGLVRLDESTECPSDVILANKLGDPVINTPADPYPFVLVSSYQSIKFSPLQPTPVCQNNVSWEPLYDTTSNQFFLKAGDIVSDLFRIELLQSPLPLYKITYCPAAGCFNVSTYNDTSVNAIRLVLSNDSYLPVMFKKHTSVITL